LYLLYQTTCAIPPPFYLARCFLAFNPKPPTKNSENVKKLNQQENMEKYVDAPFKKSCISTTSTISTPNVHISGLLPALGPPDQSSEAIGSGSMGGGALKCGGQ
jgi:hypothetical protein